ncbi:hypothetical protein AKJ63_00415 [candidate division MSBL1 archaeon SCGC-AAA259D18]|uniref:Uncharacterized protein n=1 Tax=candidate division MSBL1 archaeon SCGC-AAA259D18 TaxID=1698262 RepID=A0A133UCH4_9EURY|nr:hypothetical protein AKJ63_00415 [candidate division MSBL1 archaeon SCGC-AAA259D18]
MEISEVSKALLSEPDHQHPVDVREDLGYPLYLLLNVGLPLLDPRPPHGCKTGLSSSSPDTILVYVFPWTLKPPVNRLFILGRWKVRGLRE